MVLVLCVINMLKIKIQAEQGHQDETHADGDPQAG